MTEAEILEAAARICWRELNLILVGLGSPDEHDVGDFLRIDEQDHSPKARARELVSTAGTLMYLMASISGQDLNPEDLADILSNH